MERIVITGFGVKIPGGDGVGHFKQTLKNGDCYLEMDDQLTGDGQPLVVSKVKNSFDEVFDESMPRVARLAIMSSIEAVSMSKAELDERKTGVFFGTTVGAITPYNDISEVIYKKDYENFKPHFGGLIHYHSLSSAITTHFKLKGITKTISTGCTASLEAIQDAVLYLKSGQIDTAIVGGSDAGLCTTTAYCFLAIKTVVSQEMENAAIPFHKDSKTFAIGEGAVTLILERESTALERGAKIYGVIDEIYTNNDSQNINGFDRTGKQMLYAVEQVVKSRVPDYINSQAIGSYTNDRIESLISKKIFNHQVPITSIKSMIGHPFGAAPAAQIVASLIGFEENFIPPTIRSKKIGYEDLDVVIDVREKENKEVLITSHGYGGNNACAYILKYEG